MFSRSGVTLLRAGWVTQHYAQELTSGSYLAERTGDVALREQAAVRAVGHMELTQLLISPSWTIGIHHGIGTRPSDSSGQTAAIRTTDTQANASHAVKIRT